ncbi:uncharacterized protein LOC119397343 [Rhipicephalus sanguineus]|uniref:uncharacterized protein LOC119397343 n=1 Tax=Rhipicephalus sanguineus TaxID=34632 RepID=UPI0020C2CB18|nr:uncharacterized protein LOC119397343 [Rhipicephalus sanguineus]
MPDRAGIIYGEAQVVVGIIIILLVVIAVCLLLMSASLSAETTTEDFPPPWVERDYTKDHCEDCFVHVITQTYPRANDIQQTNLANHGEAGHDAFDDCHDTFDASHNKNLFLRPEHAPPPRRRRLLAVLYIILQQRHMIQESFDSPGYEFATAPLVCVYGSGFNESLEFPEEGLCDLTVFDSLYKDDRNPWPEPDKDLRHFLSAARRQRKSQFGLSFDYTNWRKLSGELTDGDPTRNIDDYWFDRIYHYGMVDISPYTENEFEVARTVALFEKLYELLAEKSYHSGFGQHTIIFFGFSPLNHRWVSFVPSLFTTFRPHLFVIRGHYSLINNNESICRIVAPTFQSRAPGTYFTLFNAHAALKYVADRVQEGATMLAVSASMAGRWNRPQQYLRHVASNYRFLEKCIKLPRHVQQFGNLYEVCSKPTYLTVYDRAYKAEYRYNFDDGLLLSYDTSVSLKEKLCYYKTNLTSVPPYGLALFDMQYEDWSGVCFAEKFARLRALRRLLDFLAERFRFASDLTGCLFSTRAT